MTRRLPTRSLAVATLLVAAAIGSPAQPAPTEPTIRSTSDLVLLDVVVRDKTGNLVGGLSQSAFQVFEDHHQQTIRNFEEHRSELERAHAAPLPPGAHTNSPLYEASQSRTVILFDALNSSTPDLNYARAEILDRLGSLSPDASLAVFALGDDLRMLQDFTSDRELIRKKLRSLPASSLSPAPAGSSASLPRSAQGDPTAQMEIRFRIDGTIDAFKELALYLAAVPGRKNLIWVSASFPLLIGDPQSAVGITDFADNMKKIDDMFSRARVSVYPVDPRGLMTLPVSAPPNEAEGMQGVIASANSDVMEAPMGWWDQHSTMIEVADATGGRAFFNNNAIGEAVSAAMAEASDYYTIAWVPPKKTRGDAYRKIEVRTTHPGYTLAYRRGYFASALRESRIAPDAGNLDRKVASPITAALMHGVPTLTGITFSVRQVLPTAADWSTTVPAVSLKKHESRFLMEYSIDARQVRLQPAPKDAAKAELEFAEAAYAINGQRVASRDSGLEVTLRPIRAKQTIRVPQEIALPSSACFLRVAVRDATTGRIGSLEFALPNPQPSH